MAKHSGVTRGLSQGET